MLIGSLALLYAYNRGNKWCHLFHSLRLIWVLCFGFLFITRSTLIWKFWWDNDDNDFYVHSSFFWSIIFTILIIAEFVILGIHAFKYTVVKYQTGRDPVELQVLVTAVIRDLKGAFMRYDILDKCRHTRFYNIGWIWRWIIIWLFFTIFSHFRASITLFTVLIHVLWLCYTIFCSAKAKIFFNPLTGYLMIV